mgnify:CR=1 FL=1
MISLKLKIICAKIHHVLILDIPLRHVRKQTQQTQQIIIGGNDEH